MKEMKKDKYNINHEKKIVFIHIPKTAGNSIKRVLDMQDTTYHASPTDLVSPQVWNTYFTFACIRHPIDRLLSSYFYHTATKYSERNGIYSQRFKDLEKFTLNKYFHVFKEQTRALSRMIEFIYHSDSRKPLIDYIVRFEHLQEDMNYIFNQTQIQQQELPHFRKTKREIQQLEWTEKLLKEIIEYFKIDFQLFGYTSDIEEIKVRYLY
jgi:hypothetical protein